MTRLFISHILILAMLMLSSTLLAQTAIIANHQCTNISQVPVNWITQAKSVLHIAYGHTSHGSQLTTGMTSLVGFMNGLGYPQNLYAYNTGGTGGALDLRDYAFSGASDLGNPDRTSWEASTRTYLNAHTEVNVVIWSWCGQVSSSTEEDINTYLSLMSGLERDYSSVKFVYMTGHLDGGGSDGNLNVRNQQIRNYCQTNNKILYDFTDIESYDPDGLVNYMALNANDNCDYDSSGVSRNWAQRWQNTHTLNVDWYECSAAHSQSLNGNRKAYAAWWLWARLAGWNGATAVEKQVNKVPNVSTISQNYPNPFNPTTTIEFTLLKDSKVSLKVYNALGHEVATLVNSEKKSGVLHRVPFDASKLASGVYFYRLETFPNAGPVYRDPTQQDKQMGKNVQVKKLILVK